VPILTGTNLVVAYGEVVVLDGVCLSVEPGERLGIVGRNGTGKSTLLKVLAGILKPDTGSVGLQRGERAGYLEQDPRFDPALTLRQAAAGAFVELARLHDQMESLFHEMEGKAGDELDRLLRRQGELEKRVEAAGGWAVDHKIDAVLHGLGFGDAQFGVPVGGLSGGQRGRLALARLLLDEPAVLLLDEPTNHLDIEGREWLERFLVDEYRGAVLMISHDRRMLDNVVHRIIEVEDARLIDYPGNYRAFRTLRAERRLAQHRAWEKQQTQFKKEEAYIRQYKAGQRAKQAKGRESKLERAKSDAIERPMEMAELRLSLPRAERSGDVVAVARGLCKRYVNEDGREKVLFDGLDVTISRGERWGIVGPNGAGKTTLVRCLLGDLGVDAGTVSLGSRLDVGYYRQTHDGLRMDLPVFRFIQDWVKKETGEKVVLGEQEARNLAGAFLFGGDDQEKELGVLSGGERSRAVLAGLLSSSKNLLVLDEPTNHLDISSAERLEEVLEREVHDPNTGQTRGGAYDGTLILISHDRALLDATCDKLIVLDGHGGAKVWLGTFSEWEAQRGRSAASPAQAAASAKASKPVRDQSTTGARAAASPEPATARDSRVASSHQTQAPQQAFPSAKPARPSKSDRGKFSWMPLDRVEGELTRVQSAMASLDAQLADPEVWTDYERANTLTERRDTLRAELDELEAEWLRKAQ
jgi:ATP-binding cassette subfamily F protein 3